MIRSKCLACGLALTFMLGNGETAGPTEDAAKAPIIEVDAGYCATAIPFSPEQALAGFLKPGMRVDILAVDKTSSDQKVSRVLFQNIRVLAVDSSGAGQAPSVKVTVMLTLPQTIRLARLLGGAPMSIALRKPGDSQEVQTRGSPPIPDPGEHLPRAVVAMQDIPPGTSADQKGLFKVMPIVVVPPQVIKELPVLEKKTTVRFLSKGQPVTERDLVHESDKAKVAAVEPGYQSVTVRVNLAIPVASSIAPGARVDLLIGFRDGMDPSKEVSRVFLEDIRVLASQPETDPRDAQPAGTTPVSLTLMVNPEQAKTLSLLTRPPIGILLRKP